MRTSFLILLLTLPAFGEIPTGQLPADKPPTEEELKKPVLSGTGKKRLEDNIRTLENNIRDLKTNIESTDKNLETILAELKDLEGLEKEHLELRKKYEGYLGNAHGEIAKNNKAQRDLAKWEESQKKAPSVSEALKDKLEAARLEQADRERWKFDAESKTARVKELMAGIDRNLRDIRSRRKPLESQMASWKARRVGYEKLLAETETKKAAWEKVLVR